MGNERHRPTHTQILGIVCFSAALLLTVGAIIFSAGKADNRSDQGAEADSLTVFLTSKEDSVYTQRRIHRQHGRTQYQRREQPLPAASSSPTPPPAMRQPLAVELNSADTLTLQLLYGIGPTLARRIVRYRERLGGFRSSSQLLEVYGISQSVLDRIEGQLSVDTTLVRTIVLDTVSLKQLLRHPYIEYYQARDIIALRNRGVRFRSTDDLRAVPSMADTTLERILPYLDLRLQERE